MCLSTVYVIKEEEKELLCRNIAEITSSGNCLHFIDVMGIPTIFEGEIVSVNLVDNYIDVRPRTGSR